MQPSRLKGHAPLPMFFRILRKLKRLFEKLFNPENLFYGLNDLDKKILRFLPSNPGFFVELGANDGISQSNTLYLERKRGWRGVLIEPIPHNFLKCRQNRSLNTQVFCAACVPFDYKNEFVRMVYSNLMTVAAGLDVAFPHKHAEAGKKFIGDHAIFEFGAVAKTLTSILQESGAPTQIDFLPLDVEGNELSVLRGVDFNTYVFRTMLIESHAGAEPLAGYLSNFGYKLVATISNHDHVFQHRSFA